MPDEVRHDKAEGRKEGDEVVHPTVLFERGDDAHRQADSESHQQGHKSQVHSRRPRAADQADHGLVGVFERHAEVQSDHAGEPGKVLLPDRLVEAVARLQRRELLVREEALAILPRPAGHIVHEGKGDDRKNEQDRDQPGQAHQYITRHPFLL